MLHPTELHLHFTTHPSELHCILLNYELRGTIRATLQPNWATFSTRIFVQFCQMQECRTVQYRTKSTLVRYQNATVPDWIVGCRNTDAGGIGLNDDT